MLAVKTAIRTNDQISLRIWMKTGMKMPEELQDDPGNAFESAGSLTAKGVTNMP